MRGSDEPPSGVPDAGRATRRLSLTAAASYLSLPPDAVRALVDGRFLHPAGEGPDGPLLTLEELRAFMVWNVEPTADDAGEDVIDLDAGPPGQEALLRALAARSEEMAEEALAVFAEVFPEAAQWPPESRSRFAGQAKSRFEAILAIASQGADVNEALAGDLQEVGAVAARQGAPLSQLLVALRISRDVLVRRAVDMAEQRGRHWGLALSLVLTRVLPAMDGLTDSLAQGYWSAAIGRQKDALARYEHIVERSADGVYEIDPWGTIRYANPRLGLILGRRRVDELEGASLSDVLAPAGGGAVPSALLEPSDHPQHVEVSIVRPDGVRRVLDVRSLSRVVDGQLVGLQGVVRDVTGPYDLEAEKDRALGSLTEGLHLGLARIAAVGSELQGGTEPVTTERSRALGASILSEVEHLPALIEDLTKVGRMTAGAAVLVPQPVELASVVDAALASAGVDPERMDVVVPAGLHVMADADGLQRALQDVVRTAVGQASRPMRLEVEGVASGELRMGLTDASTGATEQLPGDAGLAVARTLVEAMGGRLWREAGAGEEARIRLTVPVPNRRRDDEPIRL